MIEILLAEDHAIVRQGLRALLEQQPELRVVGEAASGLAAWRLLQTLQPDVAVLDLMLPEFNGLELTSRIHRQFPAMRVVVLSMYSHGTYVAAALRNGASAYVVKGADASHLVAAVHAVMAGKRYLSPPLNEASIAEYLASNAATSLDLYATLTAREREVFSLTAQGLSNSQVGARLFISPRTVEVHRANLMRKLGLRNHSELLRFALSRGILLPAWAASLAQSPLQPD